MEGFFGLLKRERVKLRIYHTRAEARAAIFDYIERFHNPRMRRRLETAKQNELLLTQCPGFTADEMKCWQREGQMVYPLATQLCTY